MSDRQRPSEVVHFKSSETLGAAEGTAAYCLQRLATYEVALAAPMIASSGALASGRDEDCGPGVWHWNDRHPPIGSGQDAEETLCKRTGCQFQLEQARLRRYKVQVQSAQLAENSLLYLQ